MNIENKLIRYYVQDDEVLKEYFKLYEIPKKEHVVLIEKRMSRDIADIFYQLGFKNKSELIKNCNSLRFLQQCVSDEDHKHWHSSFCKDRYCPICSHIKSHKESEMLQEIIASMQKDNNYKNSYMLFVTLTQKNVGVGELKNEINKMNKALKEMLKKEPLFKDYYKTSTDKKTGKKKKVKRKALGQGTVRHLEITAKYNPKTERIEFHAHWHLLILVKKSYWSEKDVQWTNPKLQKIWKKYMELDYFPNVDIRLAKDKDIEFKSKTGIETIDKKNDFKSLELDGAVRELCKYSTKESDIIQLNEDKDGRISINWNDTRVIMQEIYGAMNHKRTLVLTGAFKKTKERLFGKKEAEDLVEEMTEADLIQVFKNRCKTCGSEITEHLYRYYPVTKNYQELKGVINIENYKKNHFEKVNQKVLAAIEQRKAENKLMNDLELAYWEEVLDDGYDPFTMDIDHDVYLQMCKKKSDVSDQTKTSEYI